MSHQIKAEAENHAYQKIILLFYFWNSHNDIPFYSIIESGKNKAMGIFGIQFPYSYDLTRYIAFRHTNMIPDEQKKSTF